MTAAADTARGPASEDDREVWCVDCGHWKDVHHDDGCRYWTDLCKCAGFVARSDALAAVAALARLEAVAETAEAFAGVWGAPTYKLGDRVNLTPADVETLNALLAAAGSAAQGNSDG